MLKRLSKLLGASALALAILGCGATSAHASELVKQPVGNGQYRYYSPYSSKSVGNPVGSDTMGSTIYAPNHLRQDAKDRYPVVFTHHNNTDNDNPAEAQRVDTRNVNDAGNQSSSPVHEASDSISQHNNTALPQTNESSNRYILMAGCILAMSASVLPVVKFTKDKFN